MNPFISVPLGCRTLDLVERLVHGSGGRQETGSSSEDMLCWANSNGYADNEVVTFSVLHHGEDLKMPAVRTILSARRWFKRFERFERLERFELPWSGRSRLVDMIIRRRCLGLFIL